MRLRGWLEERNIQPFVRHCVFVVVIAVDLHRHRSIDINTHRSVVIAEIVPDTERIVIEVKGYGYDIFHWLIAGPTTARLLVLVLGGLDGEVDYGTGICDG